jgi:hypothetical protein
MGTIREQHGRSKRLGSKFHQEVNEKANEVEIERYHPYATDAGVFMTGIRN